MGLLDRLLGRRSGRSPTITIAAAEPRQGPSRRVDLRGPRPSGSLLLGDGPEIAVSGESPYRPAIHRAVGDHGPEGVRAVLDAALVWEPNNRNDPNAISVRFAGAVCGYLPRGDAAAYRPACERLARAGLTPYVRADVHGGFRNANGTWAQYGIVISVESVEALIRRLDRELGDRA